MSKPRKIPPGGQVVTEKRLAELLARWARAADVAMTEKLADVEARLRAELTVVLPAKEPTDV